MRLLHCVLSKLKASKHFDFTYKNSNIETPRNKMIFNRQRISLPRFDVI